MSQTFEPDRVDYLSPEAGGRLGAMTAGFPRWTMRVTLNNMLFAKADIWRAWLAVQRGAQRRFFAFDIDRQTPRFHVDGRPYNPAPTGWAQAITTDALALLTLSGLRPGQVVSIGDYIGFAWGDDRMALTRAAERGIADAAGLVTVAVEPPVPPIVPPQSAVTLKRAGCMMRINTAETSLGEQGLGFFTAGSVIVAAEDLIA